MSKGVYLGQRVLGLPRYGPGVIGHLGTAKTLYTLQMEIQAAGIDTLVLQEHTSYWPRLTGDKSVTSWSPELADRPHWKQGSKVRGQLPLKPSSTCCSTLGSSLYSLGISFLICEMETAMPPSWDHHKAP